MDALEIVLFSKALILITKSLGENLKPSGPWLLTYKHTMLSEQSGENKPSNQSCKNCIGIANRTLFVSPPSPLITTLSSMRLVAASVHYHNYGSKLDVKLSIITLSGVQGCLFV